MRQAIGSVPTYNIILVFIAITFGFLSATLSYMKAFKVNSMIAKSLESYEGYNKFSNKEIEKNLTTLGYRIGDDTCPIRDGKSPVDAIAGKNHVYCLYELPYYSNGNGSSSKYFNYGIVTYIYFDIPVIGGTIKIPIYSESEKIYNYTNT